MAGVGVAHVTKKNNVKSHKDKANQVTEKRKHLNFDACATSKQLVVETGIFLTYITERKMLLLLIEGWWSQGTRRWTRSFCLIPEDPLCIRITVKLLNVRTTNNWCNYPKNWTVWTYHRVMSPKDADWKANRVDPDQSAPLGAAWWSGYTLFDQNCLSKNLGSLQYYWIMNTKLVPSHIRG